LLDDDVVIAHSVFGKPLAPEHGGPIRIGDTETLCVEKRQMAQGHRISRK
jgi:hypothetical protein